MKRTLSFRAKPTPWPGSLASFPLILSVLALFTSSSALAQQADTAVFRVGEIIVQAARPLTTTGGASAIELKLDSLRMRAAPTLEQVLRQIPLVQVRINSRGEAQFSLRGSGSDARQVAVIVDGIPLNLGWDHRADLSVLPTTAAQTLTVARGLPSLLYGPNVLGGVVEIGVARGFGELSPRGLRFDAGADHTGATGLAAALALPVLKDRAKWLLRSGAGYRQRSDTPLPGDVTQPFAEAADDRLLNTDLDHIDGFASVSFRPVSGWWADASLSAYRAERGIAAEMHITSPRFWRYPQTSRVFSVLAGGTGERSSPLGGVGDVEVSLGVDMGHTEIDQFSSSSFTTVADEEDSDDQNVTLRMRADQTVGKNGELRAGFTYADINHDEVLTPGVAASYRQQLWSGALELQWHARALGSGTRVSLGTAVDGAMTPESGDKPPLEDLTAWGARAGFTSVLSAAVLLHGGASIRSRFPSLRELYSGALGRFEPNPNLRPEQLTAVEVGASVRLGKGELQAVAFHHALDHAIVRIAVPDRRFQRVNRDRQAGTGLELLSALRVQEFAFSADVVIQNTELTDESTGAESEPEYQPDVIAGLGLAGPLPMASRFDLRTRYTGRQSCVNPDSGEEQRLRSSTRMDAEVSRRWLLRGSWTSALEVAVGADNLTDEAIYDQCGLPQPGRTFRFQLRVR
jgi:iron complex outermembrane receptor protein